MNIVRLMHVELLPQTGVANTAYFIENSRRLFFWSGGWRESYGMTELMGRP